MATQQERDAFLRGWRAAMDEVLFVLESEAHDWAEEEAAASAGEYKLPGASRSKRCADPSRDDTSCLPGLRRMARRPRTPMILKWPQALDALVDGKATDSDRTALGLAALGADDAPADEPPAAGG